MLRYYLKLTSLIIFFGLSSILKTSAAYRVDGKDEFFETKIRPILATVCYECHTDAAKGGLRVDSREALLKGGKRGPQPLAEILAILRELSEPPLVGAAA